MTGVIRWDYPFARRHGFWSAPRIMASAILVNTLAVIFRLSFAACQCLVQNGLPGTVSGGRQRLAALLN